MILEKIKELPIIGILRGIHEDHLEPIVEALIASGLKTVEITMNTPDAAGLIRKMISLAGEKLLVGAGTVLNKDHLYIALEAGAKFIVTPSLVAEVVEHCKLNSIPVFPGALTPTEIHKAWDMGASMVKVFPASLFGPRYFKEIKAPFNNIELMAVGGVSSSTISEYFSMGASGAAFGASIFKKEYMDEGKFNIIEKEIKTLLLAYKSWKKENISD